MAEPFQVLYPLGKVSTWPNIIVADPRPPNECHVRQTSSQRSADGLHGLTATDTIDENFRPPAGQRAEPGRFQPLEDLDHGRPDSAAIWSTSGGLKPWTLTWGKCRLMSRSNYSYHSICSCG